MSNAMLDELESMAESLTFQPIDNETNDMEQTIKRWRTLFGMDHESASDAISRFRTDINRVRLTQTQWRLMAQAQNSKDHDKESFEYYLEMEKRKKTSQSTHPKTAPLRANPDLRWIFRPIRPLETVEKIKNRLSYSKEIEVVMDDSSSQSFILCDYDLKQLILAYLSTEAPLAQPTFIEDSVARKHLSPTSRYPTIGLDTTLPQHRAIRTEYLHSQVQQSDYPVPYFFYGSLADPARITRLLGIEAPHLERASIRGGILKEWKGSSQNVYRALVNGAPEDVVDGHVFVVHDERQEVALRAYETARYEVVRCTIRDQRGEEFEGLTFRFVNYGEIAD